MLVRPSIRLSVLPAARPLRARFGLAAAAGFEGVEVEARAGPPALLKDAADSAGIAIHSVHCLANYSCPLSSSDPATLAAGVRATIEAIEMARCVGADTMLLVPGVVGADSSYGEVHARSQEVIAREILPAAEANGIVLAVENVWNGFLLSPIDFAQYVDGLHSPWVRAYLDVGNIIFGRPEGWVDLLGARICKLHLKDLRSARAGRFGYAKIGEGDIDWPRVRSALERIGFSGWAVLAEPELAKPALARGLYRRVVGQAPSGRFRVADHVLGSAQTWLARRLLDDVMTRFRRHVLDC
jgi:L-ribulose-5-phosphate 3-epimerase